MGSAARSAYPQRAPLVLGVGNPLCADEGIGIHAVAYLAFEGRCDTRWELADGGTLGLALIDIVADRPALLVIDAAMLGLAPGSVRLLRGTAFDHFLTNLHRRTAHEVDLVDLFASLRVLDRRPPQCALIAVQPGTTQWCGGLSDETRRALPAIADAAARYTRALRPTRADPARAGSASAEEGAARPPGQAAVVASRRGATS